MKMAALLLLCFATAWVQGCSRPVQTTPIRTTAAQAPSQPSASSSDPVLPAALSVTDQLLTRLKDLSPKQAVEKQDQWGIPGAAVYCAGTAASSEETVLACQWGKGYDAMQDGRALFWWEHGSWKTQPYPLEGVLGQGDFRGVRREGDLLQVIMNVATGQTRNVEQVGLLQYVGDQWQTVWGPPTPSPYPDLSIVFQPPEGIHRFTQFRDEGDVHVREEWLRKGKMYLQMSRVELSQEEYSVVRFALALLRQVDPELRN